MNTEAVYVTNDGGVGGRKKILKNYVGNTGVLIRGRSSRISIIWIRWVLTSPIYFLKNLSGSNQNYNGGDKAKYTD